MENDTRKWINITCMLIASSILWFFTVNAVFFSSLVVTYVSTFSSSQGFKKKHNGYILLKNVLLKLNFQYDGQLYANCLIDILIFYRKFLRFEWFTRGIRTSKCMHKSPKKQSYFAKKCRFWSLFFEILCRLLILYSDYLL